MSFDNEDGLAMFQPELTGDELRGQALSDWIAFCEAVVQADEPLYNTLFENRWLRASEKRGGQGRDRASSVVRATEEHGMIAIHCPSKLWAEQLRGHMSKWRALSPRKFWVLGPGGRVPEPFDPAAARRQVETWKRLCSDHQAPHGPAYYQRLVGIGELQLAKHDPNEHD